MSNVLIIQKLDAQIKHVCFNSVLMLTAIT